MFLCPRAEAPIATWWIRPHRRPTLLKRKGGAPATATTTANANRTSRLRLGAGAKRREILRRCVPQDDSENGTANANHSCVRFGITAKGKIPGISGVARAMCAAVYSNFGTGDGENEFPVPQVRNDKLWHIGLRRRVIRSGVPTRQSILGRIGEGRNVVQA